MGCQNLKDGLVVVGTLLLIVLILGAYNFGLFEITLALQVGASALVFVLIVGAAFYTLRPSKGGRHKKIIKKKKGERRGGLTYLLRPASGEP